MNNPLLFFSIISLLLYIIVPVIIVVYIYKLIRRSEHRADERLQLEKENITYQQQQMNLIKEISDRLTKIEKMLKEIE